jgi:23S rRNA maturation mini-RNase III
MNMKGILPTREDHIAFLQKKAIHKHIYPKATKSIAIHLMSITSNVKTLSLAYHGDQSIWEKHISMSYVTNAVYDTKMQAWYDTYMEMQHAYVHQPSQPKVKKEKQLQALLANEQM